MTIIPDNKQNRLLAADYLRLGKVVAYPTDTVYGLGVDTLNPQSVVRLFNVKGRSREIAVPILIGSMDQLANVATEIPALAYKIAEKFWPGQLTLVLKKNAKIPLEVTANHSTIAVRIPNHPCALNLSKEFEAGIIGTSANIHGEPSTLSAAEVNTQIGSGTDLILDGGKSKSNQASTIVSVVSGEFSILREGLIKKSILESFVSTLILEGEI
ncbi:MAG: threonylcarbamoyl-AMP synthase [Chloroflexi bacterium]|nr:threonylcarbamoyl-AMP synthase [Chloroflexota bacterium]MBT17521.1 threonylcarbamoyl-AMP synthase [Dehalococcoidia bacterium]|tara:strand:- start:514 stop:1152 length:639 start_codon:yes stop_codon:yes gene_type:complete